MVIQPFTLITVAVDVIHTSVGVKTNHITVVFCIQTEAEIILTRHHPGIGMIPAIMSQCLPTCKDAAMRLIKTQCIDYRIKLILKLLCLQLALVVIPRGIELLSGAAHVTSQMPNASGLRHDLLRLGIAVHSFMGRHRTDCHFHRRYLTSLSARLLSVIAWKESSPGTRPKRLPLSKSQ